MKILVTGSSGQIGTNLCLKLMENGHRVQGIDKRPNSWTQEVPTSILDLSRRDGVSKNLTEIVSGYDLVVHLAAYAKVYELVEIPDRALDNIVMTFNVLESCRLNRLPIIFGSSREVYGDIHHHITDESHADFVVAESPYSASKISGEALIYSYSECYGLKYLVFRFSNVYGRYDSDLERMERVVPLFIDKINKRQPIVIYGPDKVLDFTYIDDCVDGLCRGIDNLHSKKAENETINLAYGEGNSLVKLSELITENLGVHVEELEVSFKPSRLGEIKRYVANISKAKSLLGYQPQTSLDEGIAKALEWWTGWNSASGVSGVSK